MFRRNNHRIEVICKQRTRGLTIDQINSALKEQGENIPRSSIGYYVNKYCDDMDGKHVKTNRVVKKRKPPTPASSEFDNAVPRTLLLGVPPQTISRKSRSMNEILEREKRALEIGKFLDVALINLFENDPDILSKRLDILVKIIFLEPYLRIDVEDLIDKVHILLTRSKK
ncbi:hypothetical protein KAI23_02240 [Candidatus Bathyarchaeota archaeon]|nr:hypothetical protein [Candidatus Bathyarchaeota archaeon]